MQYLWNARKWSAIKRGITVKTGLRKCDLSFKIHIYQTEERTVGLQTFPSLAWTSFSSYVGLPHEATLVSSHLFLALKRATLCTFDPPQSKKQALLWARNRGSTAESLLVIRAVLSLPDLTGRNGKISLRQLRPLSHPGADRDYVPICKVILGDGQVKWACGEPCITAHILLLSCRKCSSRALASTLDSQKRHLKIGLCHLAAERWKFRWKCWNTPNLISATAF